jgi:hypothetical protein
MPGQLAGISPRPAAISYFGAVGGCLDYLRVDASEAWLYGGTAWAFVMTMEASVDVASPIAWDGLCVNPCHSAGPGAVTQLEPNVGYTTLAVCSCPFGQHRDTDAARKRAWDLVRQSIDEGVPCLGFDLASPEFAIIAGYTDEGYLSVAHVPGSGAEPVTSPVPWDGIGQCVQWIRVQAIRPSAPPPEQVVVSEALRAALKRMSRPPDGGPFVVGLQGHDLWAAALEDGRASDLGHRYTAAAYAELRSQGAAFLREAKQRLPGRADGLLDEAIGHYGIAAARLQALSALHPPVDDPGECLLSPEAAELVRQAGAAERRGFPLLAQIADALS